MITVKELEVSVIYPENYNSSRTTKGEVLPCRGKEMYSTLVREVELTELELLDAAELHFKSVLQSWGVTVQQVEFTPADHLDYANKEGKPVYVFLMTGGPRKGNFVYEFETRFKILKT